MDVCSHFFLVYDYFASILLICPYIILILNSSVNDNEDSIEFYRGNQHLPVFTKDPIVLRPLEVVRPSHQIDSSYQNYPIHC